MENLSGQLRDFLVSRGATLVAYADMHEISTEVRQGLPRAVSIAVALNPEIIARLSAGPTVEYYGEYNRVNALLTELGKAGEEFLISRGHKAVAIVPTVVRSQMSDDLSMPLPNKIAATRSGLGWIGKSCLLITAQFGPAVRLTTILTDAPVECTEPADLSRCGSCTECTDHCPAGAIKGVTWKPGMKRDELFDAFACMANAQAMSAALGLQATICGICIVVCPWTKKYLSSI